MPPKFSRNKGRRDAVRSVSVKRIELKEFSTTSNGLSFTPLAAVAPLMNIAQGTDINNRVGRWIRLAYLDYVIIAQSNVTSITGPDACHISIVLDKQSNGGTPSVGDVKIIPGSNGSLAMMNTSQYRNRFRELMRVNFMFSPEGDTVKQATGRVPLGMLSEFIGSATASPGTNNIVIWYANANVNPTTTFTSNFKLVFEDI